jgi:hypothetical protein
MSADGLERLKGVFNSGVITSISIGPLHGSGQIITDIYFAAAECATS